jgi:hypothetical protein
MGNSFWYLNLIVTTLTTLSLNVRVKVSLTFQIFLDYGNKTVPALASKEATTPYYMNADPPSAKETWSYHSR